MMKRLIVVYNPRSTQYKRVEKEVLSEARSLGGWQLGKYEVKATDVDRNAARLAQILMDGDLVVAAGGDATATIALNACMISGKAVAYGALAYGNFCDAAKVCGFKTLREMAEASRHKRRGDAVEMWPLEILIDGQHWRYVLEYVTMGLFAESVVIFDDARVRSGLKKRRRTKIFSWIELAKWYFRNRQEREFLPEFSLNNVRMDRETTDYVAMNTRQMAGVMRNKSTAAEKKVFRSGVCGLRETGALVSLMTKSILRQVPLMETRGDVLRLEKPGRLMIQAVGEYVTVDVRRQIEVRKARQSVMVMRKAK